MSIGRNTRPTLPTSRLKREFQSLSISSGMTTLITERIATLSSIGTVTNSSTTNLVLAGRNIDELRVKESKLFYSNRSKYKVFMI